MVGDALIKQSLALHILELKLLARHTLESAQIQLVPLIIVLAKKFNVPIILQLQQTVIVLHLRVDV